MTIDKRRNDLNDVDLKIGIALGCGLTRERAAELAGVSVSTVYNHCEQPIPKAYAAFTRLCAESSIAHQVEINSAAIKREWEKRRSTALKVHDDVMNKVAESPALALRAAENVFDRADGKPKQLLQTSSTSEIAITYSIGSDLLDYWEGQTRALMPPQAQLAASSLPVLDAEISDQQ